MLDSHSPDYGSPSATTVKKGRSLVPPVKKNTIRAWIGDDFWLTSLVRGCMAVHHRAAGLAANFGLFKIVVGYADQLSFFWRNGANVPSPPNPQTQRSNMRSRRCRQAAATVCNDAKMMTWKGGATN